MENAFEGQYKCQLCPRKVLRTEKDLGEHLQSKGHKGALTTYYKANQKQLKHNMFKIKQKSERRHVFNMPRYQKLVRFGIHFKLISQLQV